MAAGNGTVVAASFIITLSLSLEMSCQHTRYKTSLSLAVKRISDTWIVHLPSSSRVRRRTASKAGWHRKTWTGWLLETTLTRSFRVPILQDAGPVEWIKNEERSRMQAQSPASTGRRNKSRRRMSRTISR
ncbi:hypothetical protein BCR39DRAFT_389605 [Naematelia encephala]|uniref:Secreted protein n=1 Tax=Naematelia encephala TaxID=71784 RepID=A0A1Y2AIA6_9TREE|nr:hypothetical protein BCR39DRAFT_389605 [Naematelia encephala]